MGTAIITITLHPAIDQTCFVDRVVAERKLRCTGLRRDPGGGGLNVARAIHRLDGNATAWWSSGGTTGVLLRELLDSEGIPHIPVPTGGFTRENLIVFEHASGQYYRFGLPGPHFSQDELNVWRTCIWQMGQQESPPDYLVLSGSLPPGAPADFYATLVLQAPPSTRVVLDTSGESLRAALNTKRLFLIKPNRRELAFVAGHELDGDEAVAAAAEDLVASGAAEHVVVSLGSAGAILVTREAKYHIRAPQVDARCPVGAGDSMVGAMVLAFARGESPQNAAYLGVAAGTAAVLTEGTELCRKHDVERLHAHMQAHMETAA